MAGRRPLTRDEERRLLRIVRTLEPRTRALITAQWMTGFRISEILRWTVGTVQRNGEVVPKIGLPPRQMKGGYGQTRWVPVLPELQRALESYLAWLQRRLVLTPTLPLFLSRETDAQGNARALSPDMARHIIKTVFEGAGIEDDGRLGSHTLRKTWARSLYESSGRDLLIVSAGLNHSSVAVTQAYLEPEEDEVMAAMRACDFTRGPRRRALPAPVPFVPASASIIPITAAAATATASNSNSNSNSAMIDTNAVDGEGEGDARVA